MRQNWQHLAIVTLTASIVMFTNLGGPRLWDRDEPRNAGCAQEMMERGDWVVPVFNGEMRTHKPALLYWFMMASYSVFGVNEFAARFPSALMAVGTALCTYAIGRRLFDPVVGLWSGVAIGSCLMFAVAGRAATPDSTLIFFSALAIAIFVYGAFPVGNVDATRLSETHTYFPTWPVAAAMYAVMGVAVLGKGPVGLVLPTAVIGMFLLIMRLPASGPSVSASWWSRFIGVVRVFAPLHFLRTCWAMRPITAIVVAMVVAAPWYIWVGVRTDGAFLREFFLDHNLGRATHTLEGHSGPPLLFYLAAILIGFFPWSVFAAPIAIDTVANARRERSVQPAYTFLACWIGVYVVLFSIAQTKLPSYVTPCYPAVAVLVGRFFERWCAGVSVPSPVWPRLALAFLAVIGLGLTIGLTIAASVLLAGDFWVGAVGVIPFVGAIGCWWLVEAAQRRRAAVAFSCCAAAMVTLAFAGIASRVSTYQQNMRLLARIDRTEQPRVASFGLLEPTWVFYGGRPVSELETSTKRPLPVWVENDGTWQIAETKTVEQHLAGDDAGFIITSDYHIDTLLPLLPAGYGIIDEAPYFLRDERLLLIGAVDAEHVATEPAQKEHR